MMVTWNTEHDPPEDVTYPAVQTLPYILELELLHTSLIRRDHRTLAAELGWY